MIQREHSDAILNPDLSGTSFNINTRLSLSLSLFSLFLSNLILYARVCVAEFHIPVLEIDTFILREKYLKNKGVFDGY